MKPVTSDYGLTMELYLFKIFTESKTDESKSFQQPQPQVIKPHQPEFPNFTRFAPPPTVSPNTRSVLKVMLQNKQTPANPVNQETKSDANTFMGQKICSPFACKCMLTINITSEY